MSVIKAFRVVALVLASILVPTVALAGTTAAAPTAKTKIFKNKAAKAGMHKGKVVKAKAGKLTKVRVRPGASR